MGFFMGFGLVVLAAVLFLFIFWLWMLVDCLKRDFKRDTDKIVWILVLIFLHLLGAIVYYFVVKVAGKSPAKKSK
ncbi:PLDc_N domain-containing protein [Candidatus Woesearchaeota archaeon]|nr:PLDc_N domain-containing protein [Candidatus Woesearchaeota archaeon]